MNSLNKKNEVSTQMTTYPDYILFAQIGRPHGLQGAFFLKTEDRRTQWDGYKTLAVETANGLQEKKVIKTYVSGNALVLQLEGITSRNEVEPLYNRRIYVHKTEIHLEKDEYLVNNLKGYKVVTNIADKALEIGEVIAVVSFGAQDNLEIRLNKYKENPTVFYPFIPPFIQKVDEEKKCIEVLYTPEFFDEEIQ